MCHRTQCLLFYTLHYLHMADSKRARTAWAPHGCDARRREARRGEARERERERGARRVQTQRRKEKGKKVAVVRRERGGDVCKVSTYPPTRSAPILLSSVSFTSQKHSRNVPCPGPHSVLSSSTTQNRDRDERIELRFRAHTASLPCPWRLRLSHTAQCCDDTKTTAGGSSVLDSAQ